MRSVVVVVAAAAEVRIQWPEPEVETSVCKIPSDTCASTEHGVVVVPSRTPPRPLYRSQHRAAAVAQRSEDLPRLSLLTLTVGSPTYIHSPRSIHSAEQTKYVAPLTTTNKTMNVQSVNSHISFYYIRNLQ